LKLSAHRVFNQFGRSASTASNAVLYRESIWLRVSMFRFVDGVVVAARVHPSASGTVSVQSAMTASLP
jgi:hypothetical protein